MLSTNTTTSDSEVVFLKNRPACTRIPFGTTCMSERSTHSARYCIAPQTRLQRRTPESGRGRYSASEHGTFGSCRALQTVTNEARRKLIRRSSTRV